MGWFVVPEDEKGTAPSEKAAPTADEADALIAKYANEGPPPPAVAFPGPLPSLSAQGGSIDFDGVYEAAGITPSERDQIKKAQDLLRSLPQETPVQVRRQIVEASLKAFGVPTEKIIEASVSAMEALESFIRAGQAETQRLLTEAQERIASLEKEIASVKLIMGQAVSEQETRTNHANAQKLSVQDVLEFFGQEAVAKVVQASTRLHSRDATGPRASSAEQVHLRAPDGDPNPSKS